MFVIKSAILLTLTLFSTSVVLAQSATDENPQVLPYTTPFCGYVNPEWICTIPCYEDPKCQNLGYNVSIYSCGCPAQYCPGGKIFGSLKYNSAPPLTDEELEKAPHVTAACNGYVPAEIAPYHEQIGTCGGNKPHDLQEEEVNILPFQVPFCGDIDLESVCSIECFQDSSCQTLGYNLTVFPCTCAAQICSDMHLYGSIFNQQSLPLTDDQIKLQPHVLATCFPDGCVPKEIAPYHKQIGTCT